MEIWIIFAMIITVLLIRAYARMARNKDAERIYNDYVRYKERHNKKGVDDEM